MAPRSRFESGRTSEQQPNYRLGRWFNTVHLHVGAYAAGLSGASTGRPVDFVWNSARRYGRCELRDEQADSQEGIDA